LIRFGQWEQSVQPLREAIRLDSRFVPAYSNLAGSLLALNRPDEARAVLQQVADRQLDFIGLRRLSYFLAFVQGDSKTMARELESSVGVRETNAAFGWQARTSASEGRVKAAHEQFRRGIQMSLQGNFTEVAAQLTMEDAETHAIVGQCAEARTEVGPGLGLSRDNVTLERAGRILALCGAGSEASAISSDLAKRFPEATLTVRASLPLIAAAAALQRGDAARALEQLEPVRPFDRAPSVEFWPAYLRGHAYLQRKDGAAAVAQFRNIVDHRGDVPGSMLYPLAYLGLARAAMLADDTDTARTAYDRLLVLWKEGDSNLPPLVDARVEQSRLH
jgi:tetratricopeptide (TPR) repeat protein